MYAFFFAVPFFFGKEVLYHVWNGYEMRYIIIMGLCVITILNVFQIAFNIRKQPIKRCIKDMTMIFYVLASNFCYLQLPQVEANYRLIVILMTGFSFSKLVTQLHMQHVFG